MSIDVNALYRCPSCRTKNNLHELDCRFSGLDHSAVEKAHVDIVSVVSMGPATPDDIRDASHGDWDALHGAVFDRLRSTDRLMAADEYADTHGIDDTIDAHAVERSSGNGESPLVLVSPDRRMSEMTPESTHQTLGVIHREGLVDGCLDTGLCALLAWAEYVGMSWDDAKGWIVDWLKDSGSWANGTWSQSSPEAAVESKRHVYEQGYGWLEFAEAAAGVIER